MTLTGAALGCSGGGAHPIIEDNAVPYHEDGTGGAETGGDVGSSSEETGGTVATGGTVETGGTGAAAGQEPATGGMPGTGGASETGGSSGTGGSSEGGQSGEGGAGGAAGSAETGGYTTSPCPLAQSTDPEYGSVKSDNACGIQGYWYKYRDCADATVCSTFTSPMEERSFPNEGGVMCTSGTTAGPPPEEMSSKWGAGIGLSLDETSDNIKHPIGDLAVEIVGFTFTVTGAQVPGDLRVTFPTKETEPKPHQIWLNQLPPAQPYTVYLANARQDPSYVGPDEQAELDPHLVTAIQFQIQSQPNTPVPFDFCIEGLTGLYVSLQ